MNKEEMVGNPKVMPEIIQEMIRFGKEYQPSEEIQTLASNFLECAKQDLASCKILYQEKQFSQSTYHLQQAVEKTTKSYVLYWWKFNQKDMKIIKHDSLNAFLMLLDRMSKYVDIAKKMYPALKTDNSDVKNILKDEKKRIELAKADYKVFQAMFKLFDDTKIAFENALNNVQEILAPFNISKSLKIGLKDTSSKEINKLVNGKSNSEILKTFFNRESTLNFLNKNLDFCLLYTIAGMTFPHEEYTRYPDKEIKPTDYTMDLGIVKATPELINHMERIIHDIEITIGK
jgi:hypothetical protein